MSSNELCSFNAQLLTCRVLCAFDSVFVLFLLLVLLRLKSTFCLISFITCMIYFYLESAHCNIEFEKFHLKNCRCLPNFIQFYVFRFLLKKNMHVSHDWSWCDDESCALNKCSQHLLIRT